VSEERTRQVVGAILVGVSATANAYSASRAGYGSASGTVRGPYGTSYITTNYYSPTAAAIAQTNAAFENQAMIGQHIESGRANMANIEREVLKDNTIMPGEWVGGQLHLTPPVGDTDQPKNYQISLRVGSDLHVIDVFQELQK
jgi:hypothetical protein